MKFFLKKINFQLEAHARMILEKIQNVRGVRIFLFKNANCVIHSSADSAFHSQPRMSES